MNAANKQLVLGIGGGIAAYKSVDLVRRLIERNFAVRVVLTAGAQAFVTPLTFQAVSTCAVHTQLLDEYAESGMGHIELARWADAVLIAPATANVLARLAHGFADDLLSTLCLATSATIIIAPAMNKNMWQASATQSNVSSLQRRGVRMLGPQCGEQACGEFGFGRMLEPVAIANAMQQLFVAPTLKGCTVMVTAGPTRESLDPVRYLSNHSSGKMGYAMASAAAAAGARVVLISGPVALEEPVGVERVMVTSAQNMLDAVLACIDDCDIFIAAAAVADYRPVSVATGKIKRKDAEWIVRMTPTPDILATVAALDKRPFCVGFAAETENLQEHALKKLQRKNVDMIAANRVDATDRGFGADTNALTVFWKHGQSELPLAPKSDIARLLVDRIATHYHDPQSK